MRKFLLFPTLLIAALAAAALATVAATSRSLTRDVARRIQDVRRANALAFRVAHLTDIEEHEVLAYRSERRPPSPERIAAADREIDAISRDVAALGLSQRGLALWSEVVAARAMRTRERQDLFAAVAAGSAPSIDRAYARWNLASGLTSAAVADLSVYNLRRLERAASELERVRSRSVALLAAVLAAGALLTIGFSLLVERYFVKPVRAMTEAARRIASDREEIAVPGGGRRDELGVLARAVTRTAGELVRANTELGRSIAARDEFLSIASHELKTPLTALKLNLQGAARRWHPGPLPQWLQAALRQLERVEGLVSELLDLARIRSGRLTLRPASVDLADLARGVADRLRDTLARSGNALDVEIGEGIPGDCDAGRIEQVLANLLVNAAQHAPGAHVVLRAQRDGDVALLSVRDDGPGIPRDALERIFQPYEKIDRVERGQGLGLGLYIARQIVEAHGGRIRADSEPGGGAAFTVELPAARRSTAGPGAPS